MSAALRAVALRARLQRALDAWVVAAAVMLAVLAVSLLTKTGQGGGRALLAWAALILPALYALGRALWPLPSLPIARAIDRALVTPDLVSSALELSALPSGERSAFEQACIVQAELAVQRLRPSAAWPFTLPRATSALCALALLCLSIDGRRIEQRPARLPASTARAPQLLDADSARAFAVELAAMQSQPLSKEAREVAEQLNALLESLARGELDRPSALSKLRALEDRLESVLAEDPAAFEAALERMAQALKGSPEAGPLSAALAEQPALAPQALEQLGERARLLKQRAAEQLASALERAAHARGSERTEAALDAAKRELDRLQKEREQSAAQGESEPDARDERLLKRKQREVEQLASERAGQQAAERQLERLQRELDAASRALQNDQRQAAQDALREAARAMEQAASGQSARDQAQRLSEQLAQLRAELAQQRAQNARQGQGTQSGQAGQAAPLSMQRFGQLARGKQGDGAGEGQQQQADGEQGVQGARPGDARPGQGPSAGEGAGVMMPLAQPGSGAGPTMQGQAPAGARSKGEGEGKGAGLGGTPESGAATKGSGAHVDTRIEGERRAGPTRSEIIYESGQRGFASGDYAKVHEDYARHAEGVIERQHIPSGYRFYVRRYFQLIRPREMQSESP
jgi:hypothetical protein